MDNITILPKKLEEWSALIKRLTGKEYMNITFQVTENCCMACTYCYQHHKTNNKMTFDTAKKIIDILLNQPEDEYGGLIIDFIGGEPFMEIDLIRQISDYVFQILLDRHSSWLPFLKFSICSNGLLYFDQRVQDYFKKYNNWISFTISIDGNKELHDSCRVDCQGNGTYDRAIQAVRHYKKYYNPLLITKMTLSPANISFLYDSIINLINEGYEFIPVNCIFEEGWNYSNATIMYNELKKLGDYLIQNNLYDKIYIRLFNEMNFQPLPIEDNTNWCGGVIKDENDIFKYFAIDYQGRLFPCIRYMESSLNGKQPPLQIGFIDENNNIEKNMENIQLLSNITRQSQSTDECINCSIATGCSWCSGYNYEEFGTPNKRATYICCMHQAASLANVYFLNTIYKKLNINKSFPLYLSKDKALNIIDENEYNFLLNLSK